jgi:omega-6 fatty acid desaturase (delta-12 desaturase)
MPELRPHTIERANPLNLSEEKFRMHKASRAELRGAIAPFEQASASSATVQLVTSAGLYVALCALMYFSLSISYLLTLALAIPAAAALVRTFIVQHDCGHGSFLRSPRANDVIGALCGVLTLAPYANWKRQHAQHHANWNNLDRRDSGADIYSTCITVAEYRALSPLQRVLYRLPRNVLLANFIIPPLVFLLFYRFPFDAPKTWTTERRSVWLTNAALTVMLLVFGFWLGFGSVAMVQLPIFFVTTVVGFWLFSVQHRFENGAWLRQSTWSFDEAALNGSSHLALPRVLQWATGNIGYHHIHHLSPRVPNYRLAACHQSSEFLRPAVSLSLGRALAAGNLTLWDEDLCKLVRFSDVRGQLRQRVGGSPSP